MRIRKFHELGIQARDPAVGERVLVVSEDPGFWLGLRREAPELEPNWFLAGTARECLGAVEDPRVKVVILDGLMNDKPATELLLLLKQIRPDLWIVFAYDSPREDWEREARQAGVLYYGARSELADMVHVVRQNLRRTTRGRVRPPSPHTEGTAG